MGTQRIHNRLSRATINNIADAYESGTPLSEICNTFKISKSAILRIIDERGIPRRRRIKNARYRGRIWNDKRRAFEKPQLELMPQTIDAVVERLDRLEKVVQSQTAKRWEVHYNAMRDDLLADIHQLANRIAILETNTVRNQHDDDYAARRELANAVRMLAKRVGLNVG